MKSIDVLQEITKIKKELDIQTKAFYVQSGALKTQTKINEQILQKLTKIEEDIKALATRVALLENTNYKPDYTKYYKDFFRNEPTLKSETNDIIDQLNLRTIFKRGEE